VNGPSSSASSKGSVLKPFAWRKGVDEGTAHLGLPAVYDFPFVTIKAAEL